MPCCFVLIRNGLPRNTRISLENEEDNAMLTPLRTSRIGSAYYQALRDYLVDPVTRTGATPNQLSVLSTAVALVVPIGFAVHPIVGVQVMVISAVIDSLDGVMARHLGLSSKWGQFVDAVLDQVSDVCYLVGIWLLLWHHPSRLAAQFLLVAALLVMLLTGFVRAKAEALGVASPPEVLDRSLRVIFLIVWGLATVIVPGWRTLLVWLGLLAFITFCLTALFLRVQRIRTAMQPPGVSVP